jgi:hypothetical protein
MSHLICDIIEWATNSGYSAVPATELVKQLPNEPGEARERMIRDFALRGDVPKFVQSWVAVPVMHNDVSGEFYCSPDFLSIGNDDDFLRVRINGVTAELIGEVAHAMLPTRMMVNAIYSHAMKLAAIPWGPPYDHSMMRTERWEEQDTKIDKQAGEKGYELGQLWAGHLKNVVVGSGLAKSRGSNIGIYGWFDKSGQAIQGPNVQWGAHEWTYTDYSQGIRFIHKEMLVGGVLVPVKEVLQDPDLAPLISDEGTVPHCSYREFHPSWLS